MRSVVHFY